MLVCRAVVRHLCITGGYNGFGQLAVSRLQKHFAALHRLFIGVEYPVLLTAGAARARKSLVGRGVRVGELRAFAHRGGDRHGGRKGPVVGFVGHVGTASRLVARQEAVEMRFFGFQVVRRLSPMPFLAVLRPLFS